MGKSKNHCLRACHWRAAKVDTKRMSWGGQTKIAIGVWGLICALVACSPSHPLDQLEPGETGRVVRVLDGDALILETGQSVRLIGIEAPAAGYRDREAAPYSDEASRLLEDMALGRQVQLFYSGLTRDRYDRALAHVRTMDASGPDLWLNLEQVKRGGAQVRLYPDTAVFGSMLLQEEQAARLDQAGLWSNRAYRIKASSAITPEDRGFMLVELVLGPRRAPDEARLDTMACRRAVTGSDFVVNVRRSASALCAEPDGGAYRMRGWVSSGYLDLVLPLHAEALD